MGYSELAQMIIEAEKSQYYSQVVECQHRLMLADETIAIIVRTLDMCKEEVTTEMLEQFVDAVTTAQLLMPSGTLRSRQIIATIAMLGGLK